MAGGTLRASTLTNHVKPMTASWCGTPGRTQGKPALPWSQVSQRGGPTTHHDHVMVVARLVAPKASQRYLGPRFGLMGLRIQHFIDAADVPLSCSILQSLKGVVNILVAGRAPPMIASFLAGGTKQRDRGSCSGSSKWTCVLWFCCLRTWIVLGLRRKCRLLSGRAVQNCVHYASLKYGAPLECFHKRTW
ncbi:hypothetical protein EMCRGX_G010666 [Ephydatia muelleri]